MGSCGFMTPKVVSICAKPLLNVLTTAKGDEVDGLDNNNSLFLTD